MKCLVVAEHDGATVRAGSLAALGFAADVAAQTGGSTTWLILGHELNDVSQHAARYAAVLAGDHPLLAAPTADRYAAVIDDQTRRGEFDLVVAAASTFAKDVVGRAGGLLGGAMASDVVAHRWENDRLVMQRPMYAGAVLATGCAENDGSIQGVADHDGGQSVKKEKMLLSGDTSHILGQGLGSEGPGGQDDDSRLRNCHHFFAHHLNAGVFFHRAGDLLGKGSPVHGQGATGRHGMALGDLQQQAVQSAEFRLQDPTGTILQLGSQRIGANQFGKFRGRVRRCGPLRSHLEQTHGQARLSDLPGCF